MADKQSDSPSDAIAAASEGFDFDGANESQQLDIDASEQNDDQEQSTPDDTQPADDPTEDEANAPEDEGTPDPEPEAEPDKGGEGEQSSQEPDDEPDPLEAAANELAGIEPDVEDPDADPDDPDVAAKDKAFIEAMSEKNRKRWDKLLGERKDAKAKLEELEPLAEHGRKIEEIKQATSLTDEELETGHAMMAVLKTDSKKGIDQVWNYLTAVCEEAGVDINTLPGLNQQAPPAGEDTQDQQAQKPLSDDRKSELRSLVDAEYFTEDELGKVMAALEGEPQQPAESQPKAEKQSEEPAAPETQSEGDFTAQVVDMLLADGVQPNDLQQTFDSLIVPGLNQALDEDGVKDYKALPASVVFRYAKNAWAAKKPASKSPPPKKPAVPPGHENSARGGGRSNRAPVAQSDNVMDMAADAFDFDD